MLITGIIIGLLITLLALRLMLPRQMITVNESKHDFDKTVEMIENLAGEHKWSMPNQYDLQQTMAKHGYQVDKVKVFSICKPDIASRILTGDKDRYVSAMMPCRVAVYETSDGKTYISRLNASLFSNMLGGNVKSVMKEAGESSEELLKSILK